MADETTPEAEEQTVLLQVPITFDPAATNPERIAKQISDFLDVITSEVWDDDVVSPTFGSPGIGDVTVVGLLGTYETWIVWGAQIDASDSPSHYSFSTEAELSAFMDGVEEASGWTQYEQFDTEEEAQSHLDDAIYDADDAESVDEE